MKKILSLKLFLALVLLTNSGLYAEDIWIKNFSNDINKGYWGSNSDLTMVTDWSLDISLCSLADDSDYVKVVETGGGRFEAVDCDGEAVWKSKDLDISGYTNCSIGVLAAETGTSTNANKYVKFYYQIDNGAELPFESHPENIGNWGSLTAEQPNIEGNTLQIIVKINNPLSSNKVYFDEIRLTGDPIVKESDKLTVVKASEEPISSLAIDTKIDTESEAITCFKFTIDESNLASDELPTQISRMTFYNAKPENGLNWKEQLGGMLLFESNQQIKPKSVTISADSIFLDFNKGQVEIPDKEHLNFELRVYLNSDNPIQEGQGFQLKIKKNALGFETFETGSGFAAGCNDNIVSAIHLVNVEATKFAWYNFPDSIQRNHYFSISVKAVDEFGNIDSNKKDKTVLSLYKGSGQLQATNALEQELENGMASFDSLRYSSLDTIQLAISSSDLPQNISNNLIIGNSYESQPIQVNWMPSDTLLSSLIVNKNQAIELFRFAIKDAGMDELPCILKKMEIGVSNNNQVDLKKSMGGFYLMKNNIDLEVNLSLEKDRISIDFQDNPISIESESCDTISLYAYFKSGKVIDNQCLQFKIDSSSDGWEVSSEGSDLKPNFDQEIVGPAFTCDVRASKMNFTDIPNYITVNKDFGLGIELVDEFQNRDTNSDKKVRLSLAAGTGKLSSETKLEKSIDNSLISWNDLRYDKAEYFSLQAEANGLETILSDEISAADRNTSIRKLENYESSELNPYSADEENACMVLRFTIQDSATNDSLPCIINQAKFYKKDLNNSFDWQKHIAGAILKSEGKVIAKTSNIDTDCISFSSTKGIMQIPSGTIRQFELGIYFKQSLLPDHKSLQIYIPYVDNGWKTASNSSELMNKLNSDLESQEFHFNIQADRLQVISKPFSINDSNTYFNLTIGACDKMQNIDLDCSDSFSLEVLKGDGELHFSPEKLKLSNGIAHIDSIKYMGKQDFRMLVASDLLPDTCSIFVGRDTLNIHCNFEKNDLSDFENHSDWSISTYKPIVGSSSLKHNLTEQSGRSYISREIPNLETQNGSLFWQFIIKNGDWDPSSGNYFVVHLLMDKENPDEATVKYSVGVNLNSSNDLLSLWKTESGSAPVLLSESKCQINENESIAIQVIYNANGTWQFSYNRLGEEENFLHQEVPIVSQIDMSHCFTALDFHFATPSRSGKLWFDNLLIQSANTAPFIKSHQIIGKDSILLEFSEALDSSQIFTHDNIKIFFKNQEVNDFIIEKSNQDTQLILKTNENLKTGKYRIEVYQIKDSQHKPLEQDRIEFEYLAPAQAFYLVINEIMADETPTQGLPEYEYIELYNTREYPISVKDWKIKAGDREADLQADTLPAHSYLILCSTAAAESFKAYSKSMGVPNFPGLTNAGANLQIVSSQGEVIDQITYSDSWYGSAEKAKGGWSLERIDLNNTCSTVNNWQASSNEKGGTPGMQNSNFGVYVDSKAPGLIAFQILSEKELHLEFDEDIVDSNEKMHYQLSGNEILEINSSQTSVDLKFANGFSDSQAQELKLMGLQDECGNVLDSILHFTYHEFHVNDLVINEIMADETPTQGLPEYEYIELYNTREYPISVKDWKIKAGDREANLQADTLPSHSYLILCSTTAAESFKAYGKSMGVPNFPGLTNAGASLQIVSPQGEVIDQITYSDSWYGSAEKAKGGWSLERIDPDNTSWQKENWTNSVAVPGGTPGQVNSVYGENIDEIAPYLSEIFVLSEYAIKIRFSEPIRQNAEEIVKNIKLYPDDVYPKSVSTVDELGCCFILEFANELIRNSEYKLTLSTLLTDLAGNPVVNQQAGFWIPDEIKPGDIIINELLFNPLPGGSDYIELYNESKKVLRVSDLYIAKRDDNYRITDSIKIPNNATMLQPTSYLILTEDSLNIAENYFTSDPNTFYTLKIPNYNDDHGRVVILTDKEIIDDFEYKDEMHFDMLASTEGVALERINPKVETNKISNWQSAAQNVGFGTPGLKNSVFNDELIDDTQVSLSSKVFSPNNDGIDDRLYINFSLAKDGYLANVRIFNSTGKEIRKLASNLYLGQNDQIFWDGLSANKERLPLGIYLVYVELFNTNGQVKNYKKTCVLGGRFN